MSGLPRRTYLTGAIALFVAVILATPLVVSALARQHKAAAAPSTLPRTHIVMLLPKAVNPPTVVMHADDLLGFLNRTNQTLLVRGDFTLDNIAPRQTSRLFRPAVGRHYYGVSTGIGGTVIVNRAVVDTAMTAPAAADQSTPIHATAASLTVAPGFNTAVAYDRVFNVYDNTIAPLVATLRWGQQARITNRGRRTHTVDADFLSGPIPTFTLRPNQTKTFVVTPAARVGRGSHIVVDNRHADPRFVVQVTIEP